MKDKKFKVAHILHSVGGVDVSLRFIVENCNPLQIENSVIHGVNDTTTAFYDKNKNQINEFKLPIQREISVWNDLRAIFQVVKIIKNVKPDLIHSHSAKGGVIGRIVGFLLGIRVLHTPQAFSYLSSNNTLKKQLFLFIEKIFTNTDSILLASSNSEKDRAIQEVGFKPENVILFNNAITPITDLEPISIHKSWPDQYICTVGRPCFQKNIEEMINIIFEVKKKGQPIHLIIMGVGHFSDQLELVKTKIHELDLGKEITLLNWTSRQDVLSIISQSRLYISTARYEGLPYSVIESMALSIPSVVSNCDGNRDLVINNYNGFLIKQNDICDFSDKIIELLNNTKMHQEFSKNTFTNFNLNFNMLKNINDLETIYLSQKVEK